MICECCLWSNFLRKKDPGVIKLSQRRAVFHKGHCSFMFSLVSFLHSFVSSSWVLAKPVRCLLTIPSPNFVSMVKPSTPRSPRCWTNFLPKAAFSWLLALRAKRSSWKGTADIAGFTTDFCNFSFQWGLNQREREVEVRYALCGFYQAASTVELERVGNPLHKEGFSCWNRFR